MRFWQRHSTLTILATATVAGFAVWSSSVLLLEHPTSRNWITEFHPAGGSHIQNFDPETFLDITHRSLAIATAIVGVISWHLGSGRYRLTCGATGAILSVFVVAWILFRSSPLRIRYDYVASCLLIEAMATYCISVRLSSLPRQSRRFRFTIRDALALTALVAIGIIFAPHFDQILHFKQRGNMFPPASSLYSTFNWWLLVLGSVASANSVAWILAARAASPRRWTYAILACLFSISVGYATARWYREYELFWPPISGFRKSAFYSYHSYMYWLLWQGIYQSLILWLAPLAFRRIHDGATGRLIPLLIGDGSDPLMAEPSDERESPSGVC